MVPYDQNQTVWGSRLIYPDGSKLPWQPERWVIHYGGGANRAGEIGGRTPHEQIAAEQSVLRSWQKWHIQGKGWQDIAYNYAVGQSGTIYRLRGENRAGATRGDYDQDGIPENHEARAVVFILGGDQTPTDAAYAAFRAMWVCDPMDVIGHRDVYLDGSGGTATACPGQYLTDWIEANGYRGATLHSHTVNPTDLPRHWADEAWDDWVEASNTNPDSRTWELYREDLAWVYSRVIEPLKQEVAELRQEVRNLQNGANALTLPATVTLVQPE